MLCSARSWRVRSIGFGRGWRPLSGGHEWARRRRSSKAAAFRNFNEPTLSLLVLDDHHRARFSFDRQRVERVGGATLVTLAFTERDTPTLIRDPNGEPVFVKGEMTVEAGSGRVRRVQLTAKND
jgi:hypothetical protein